MTSGSKLAALRHLFPEANEWWSGHNAEFYCRAGLERFVKKFRKNHPLLDIHLFKYYITGESMGTYGKILKYEL